MQYSHNDFTIATGSRAHPKRQVHHMPSTLHIERADGELTYRIQIGLDGELIITKAGDDSTMVIRPHHSNQVSIL